MDEPSDLQKKQKKWAALAEYILIIGFLVAIGAVGLPLIGNSLLAFFISLSNIISGLNF